MLLYTMTNTEIYREINNDIRFIISKIHFYKGEIFQKINKYNRKKFPISITKKITINNNIVYITFVATSTRNNILFKVKINYIMINYNGKKKMVEVTIDSFNQIEYISIYSSHFFERYSERLNLSLHSTEAIEHFISHYHRGTFYSKDDKVFEPYPFGVGLGKKDKNFLYINTFVSNDLFFEKQIELANIIKEKHIASIKIVTIL